MTLAFDLFAGARGWEAALDDDELDTIGFELDPDACATARAAGLHTVQDDVARLVPETVALVYGQPEGICGSPPCPAFSMAGKGAGRRLMEELHRAVTDAAGGASDIAMARHRRELRRLLRVHLCESGPKRLRADISAEAERTARNVSLVWQPARWVARLHPRWVALEQVPAVLPLWQAMARALEQHGYKTWCGILSSERFGVAQTRKRAILLASLDHQPQPPEATHQAYVPGEPARGGEPDLFGPGLRPWRSMAEALGWGASTVVNTRGDRQTPGGNEFSADRPSWALTEKGGHDTANRQWVTRGVPSEDAKLWTNADNASDDRTYERDVVDPAPTVTHRVSRWQVRDPESVVLDRRQTDGNGTPVGPRPATAPAPAMTAQGLAAGRDVWRGSVDDPDAYWNRDDLAARKREAPKALRSGQSVAGVGRAERGTDEPSLSVIGRFDLCSWVEGRPATTVNGDPQISEPGHHDSNVSSSQRANAVRVSVHEAATLQSFPPDWPWWACRSQTAAFTCIGNAIPPLMARRILRAVRGDPIDDRTEPV